MEGSFPIYLKQTALSTHYYIFFFIVLVLALVSSVPSDFYLVVMTQLEANHKSCARNVPHPADLGWYKELSYVYVCACHCYLRAAFNQATASFPLSLPQIDVGEGHYRLASRNL